MPEENESAAAKFFRDRPDLEEKIRSSEDFARWRKKFRQIDVNSSKYFILKGEPMVSGGDRLLDEYELMLEWGRTNGLID